MINLIWSLFLASGIFWGETTPACLPDTWVATNDNNCCQMAVTYTWDDGNPNNTTYQTQYVNPGGAFAIFNLPGGYCYVQKIHVACNGPSCGGANWTFNDPSTNCGSCISDDCTSTCPQTSTGSASVDANLNITIID